VQQIAEADGISVVVEKSKFVYAPPSLDITNEVIRKVDALRTGAGAAPSE
jgi:Skp family chaperone for outer membrane proteins